MATAHQAHEHHYVPRWYQKFFLGAGQSEYFYLDLSPFVLGGDGKKYQKQALRKCGPAACFCEKDLYTLKLGTWSTDEIEKKFFGEIDNCGRDAVKLFSNYAGMSSYAEANVPKAFQDLVQYMDAQRFRTPRGLDQLRTAIKIEDRNSNLLAMRRLFRFHQTTWMEGVWEIVSARQSKTKFIVSDEPVTFFNRRAYPSELTYPKDAGLEQLGTRTIFPLSLDACLIITHIQLVRDPWSDASTPRENARAYANTMKYLLDTQFGRELEEDEVLRINVILKRRASRYIAAADEDWLYPERAASTTDWSKLDHDWFLFPHLYKVPFKTGIMAGGNGHSWAQDEHGRSPFHPRYNDEQQRGKEWKRHIEARHEWAKKRQGRSLAHVDRMNHDEVHDAIMRDFLAGKSD
jgi:hypothetical protein